MAHTGKDPSLVSCLRIKGNMELVEKSGDTLSRKIVHLPFRCGGSLRCDRLNDECSKQILEEALRCMMWGSAPLLE